MKSSAFSQKLLHWFDLHGRKNLPWQKNKSPYRVWVSEVMLQQTQVTTVIPYFENFMRRFPTLADLAQAPEDKVLHLWTGLGYYARARNLHRSAKLIVEKFEGKFPATFESLMILPGIGRSTAHAILSICFKQNTPIMDGNVKRVLTRLHGIEGYPGSPAVEKTLWEIAEHSMKTERTAEYTQAMMDLGAMICTRSQPKCPLCPFQKTCLAYRTNRTAELPTRKTTTIKPTRRVFVLVCQQGKKILLMKRPSQGIWGGLWSLPEVSELPEIAQALETLALVATSQEVLGAFRHTFTHFHYMITPVILACKKNKKLELSRTHLWYDGSQNIGLPQPIKQLLEDLS